jgi:hypothetical protein
MTPAFQAALAGWKARGGSISENPQDSEIAAIP